MPQIMCVNYTCDVCNHFSSLPMQNTSVMGSNVDKIPAGDLHGKVTESSVSSLIGEAVTISTNVDSDVPNNGADIGLSLTGQEQFPPFCVGDLSSSSVKFDVDLASLVMILLLDLSLYLLLHLQ